MSQKVMAADLMQQGHPGLEYINSQIETVWLPFCHDFVDV
jgi:hypothetical protein